MAQSTTFGSSETAVPHIVFSGGGTGGHLFPGLAVAQYVAGGGDPVRITFCGAGRPFEQAHVQRAGFDFQAMPCHPLPQHLVEVWRFLKRNRAGIRQAARFLLQEQVSLVVGLGGFASVPMARAAVRKKIPLVLLEQNTVPGRVTRWLAPTAKAVCLSLPDTARLLPSGATVELTGNPLRPELASTAILPTHRRAQRLVILGGSRGAADLNEAVPRALHKLRKHLAGWQIVHQSGDVDEAATRLLYKKFDLPVVVVPFVQRLPQVLGASQLAISRAGGTTLAELAAAGVPAVLLPLPSAKDDHQGQNARYFTGAGAAIAIDRREFSGRLDDQLVARFGPLLGDRPLRHHMATAMFRLGRPRATQRVAAIIESLLGRRRRTRAA